MACKHLENSSFPDAAFSSQSQKGSKKKKQINTVSRLAPTSAVDSRNFSDTLVWLNNSEKYKNEISRKIQEIPQVTKPKSLCVSRDHRNEKVT